MKWDTIKNKAVTLAYEQFKKDAVYAPAKVNLVLMRMHLNGEVAKLKSVNPNHSIGDTLKTELWTKIKEVIDRWDIRQWKGLRELYPNAFTKGELIPELTDKGWELL